MSVADLEYRPDVKITSVLAQGGFTVSAEVIPPRNGAEHHKVLEQIAALIGAGAQFLAVTKGAGGSLRGGSLPIAQVIKERLRVPCIAHFTCRDIVPAEVENQLMDHHYFGIRNILALRGDPPDGQPDWKARAGGYDYAYQLMEQIRNLNQGSYLPRPGGPDPGKRDATDFCIGATAYPEHPDERAQVDFLRRKVEAGAEYAMTDMLFDADAYARFRDRCFAEGIRIPILPGTRVVKSKQQADRMMERFRVRMPAAIYSALPEDAAHATGEGLRRCIEVFEAQFERLKGLGAPGIHLFVISDTAIACQTLSSWVATHPKSV